MDTAAVALGRGIFLVLALVLIPAFVLSLLVPFFFLAAWIANKPPKFIKGQVARNLLGRGRQLRVRYPIDVPDLGALDLALWQISWGLMLIWAAMKRAAAPQGAARSLGSRQRPRQR